MFVNLNATADVDDLDFKKLVTETKDWSMAMVERVAEWKHESTFNWKLAGTYQCLQALLYE